MTDEQILDLQRALWGLGDYTAVARHLHPISVDLVSAAGVRAGQRVLDVAVGSGNTAALAAAAGAEVVGIDLSPAQLDLARTRLAAEGHAVQLDEGNVESLPYDDAAFDVVLSCMGAIFAPDHAAATAEMARVCAPGGIVAFTAWTDLGWATTARRATADLLPPPPVGIPRSDEWGDPSTASARLAAVGLEATVVERPFDWHFASLDDALAFCKVESAPFVAMFAQAAAAGVTAEVEAALRATLVERNEETDGRCSVPAPYLLLTGSR